MTRFVVLLVASALLATAALSSAPSSARTSAAAIPSGLTPHGREVWNLDALVNDTFGRRRPCWNNVNGNIFSVPQSQPCPYPRATYSIYTFTFLNAFRSRFYRTAQPPRSGNFTPVRIANRYVYCGSGKYLILPNTSLNAPVSCG